MRSSTRRPSPRTIVDCRGALEPATFFADVAAHLPEHVRPVANPPWTFLDTIDVIRRVPNVSTWPEIEDAAEPIIETGLYQGVTAHEAARKLTAVTAPMFARAK